MTEFKYRSLNLDLFHIVDEVPDQKDFVIHTHIVFQVSFLLRGKCIYHIEGSEYPMEPGDLVVIYPQETHYIEVSPQYPCERVSINFGPSFFHALDPDGALHRPFTNREPGRNNYYSGKAFDDIDYTARINSMLAPGNDRFDILIHFMQLLRDIRSAFDRTEYHDSRKDTLENRVIRYIHHNLRNDLSLDVLCEKFFVSKAQLYRRFKKATGTTVSKYVLSKRMLSARQMILDKEKATRICLECGFQDYSTFYRAYQRYFGHTPRDERQDLPSKLNENIEE